MPPEAGQSRAAHLHGDRALRLGQEALDQDIWRQIWRANLRVPETHTLPLSKGSEALWAPGHCIVGQCCSGQERCISNILLEPLNAKPPMAVGEVKQLTLRCRHVRVIAFTAATSLLCSFYKGSCSRLQATTLVRWSSRR